MNIHRHKYFNLLFFLVLSHPCFSQVFIADAAKIVGVNDSAEIIVDNGDPGFYTIGNWNEGTFGGGYLDDYIWATVYSSSSLKAYWTFDVTSEDDYELRIFYHPSSNRTTNALYRIQHAEGVTSFTLDQTSGGDWQKAGVFHFSPGEYLLQALSQTEFSDPQPMIIDDGDPLFETTGSWSEGTVSYGYGDDYLFKGCTDFVSGSATWTIPVMVEGNYEISVHYSAGGNRNPETHYTVPYANGVLDLKIDQTHGDTGWRSFGALPLNTGITNIVMDNSGPSGCVVIADAVRAEYTEYQGPPKPEIDVLTDITPLPAEGESFPVTASLWSIDPLKSVYATKINSAGDDITTPLLDDGLHNDGEAGDNIYGGRLPGGPERSVLRYEVGAETKGGASAVSTVHKCLVAYEEFRKSELRWIFGYSINNPENIDALLERVRSGNFNALSVSVRSIADAYYQSSYEPMNPNIPEGFDPLGYLIEKAHDTSGDKQYIQVHPLVLVYRVLTVDTPPPGHVLDLHPEWISENYAGETYYQNRLFMDPGVLDVQDYLLKVFMEIVTKYDVDGFNLDFIRYPEKVGGYNPIALDYFHQATGRSDRPLPEDPEWSQWRRDQVTNFVKRFYANVMKVKPEIIISADGVCSREVEDRIFYWNTFQDWPMWLEKGYIDLLLGMAYAPEIGEEERFEKWLDFAMKNQNEGKGVAIVGAYKNPVQHSLVQMHKVRKEGSDVISVFAEGHASSDNIDSPEFHNAVKKQFFPTKVPPPEWDWKKNPGTGVIMGEIFSGTEPGGRMTIELLSVETALSDLNGFYTFIKVPPGEYTLSLKNSEGDSIKSVNLDISSGDVIEYDFYINQPAPEVTGIVSR